MKAPRPSFDLLDTALTRTVARPTDLFLLLGQRHALDPEHWMERRVEAEQTARRRSGREDIPLEAIYRQLAPGMGWSKDKTRQAMAAELAMEAECLRPVPEIRERIARLHREGHPVIFISDMYLPADFLREQLVRHGFWQKGDALFTSAEEGVTKHSGALYRVALSREHLEPGELCHTGDHPDADDRAARRMGLRTTPFTPARLNRYEEQILRDPAGEAPLFQSRTAAASRLARLSRPGIADPQEQTLWNTGASVIGPLLSGMVAWVLREAGHRGIRRLYFISRDGQILQRIAQSLCRSWNLNIDCRYLYGSRQAWNLPALTSVDENALGWILKSTLHLSVNSILRRVGLDSLPPSQAVHIEAFLKENGFPKPSWRQTLSPPERECLKDLLPREPIRSAILAEAKARQNIAAGYLRQEGLLDDDNWAIVDMGWTGRMQRSLRTLLDSLGGKHPVTGFYFALNQTSPPEAEDHLFSYLDTTAFAADGMRRIPVLEILSAADHPSVAAYRREANGRLGPVFHPNALEARNFPWVRIQQDAAVAFAEEWGHLISAKAVLPENTCRMATRLMRHFFGSPSREEALAYRLFRAGEEQAGGRLYRLSSRISPRYYRAVLLRGGRALYRLRWPEACIAGSLDHPRIRIALLHARFKPLRDDAILLAHPDSPPLPLSRLTRLHLVLGTPCNCRCSMCYQTEFRTLMKPAHYETALRPLFPYLHEVILQGGEPTILPQTRSFAHLVLEANPGVRFSLFTNGQRFDEGWTAFFRDHGHTGNFSINAATESTYRRITSGEADWKRLLEHIRGLASARKESGSPVRIQTSFVLIDDNLSELAAFLELSRSLGADAIQFFFDPSRLPHDRDQAERELQWTPRHPQWLAPGPLTASMSGWTARSVSAAS